MTPSPEEFIQAWLDHGSNAEAVGAFFGRSASWASSRAGGYRRRGVKLPMDRSNWGSKPKIDVEKLNALVEESNEQMLPVSEPE